MWILFAQSTILCLMSHIICICRWTTMATMQTTWRLIIVEFRRCLVTDARLQANILRMNESGKYQIYTVALQPTIYRDTRLTLCVKREAHFSVCFHRFNFHVCLFLSFRSTGPVVLFVLAFYVATFTLWLVRFHLCRHSILFDRFHSFFIVVRFLTAALSVLAYFRSLRLSYATVATSPNVFLFVFLIAVQLKSTIRPSLCPCFVYCNETIWFLINTYTLQTKSCSGN